jgi:hypothetical protein
MRQGTGSEHTSQLYYHKASFKLWSDSISTGSLHPKGVFSRTVVSIRNLANNESTLLSQQAHRFWQTFHVGFHECFSHAMDPLLWCLVLQDTQSEVNAAQYRDLNHTA